MDQELFELCKDVYDRLEWQIDMGGWIIGDENAELFILDVSKDQGSYDFYAPLYTSDYLLEKLPAKIVTKKDTYGLIVTPYTSDGTWIADYCVTSWGQPLSGIRGHWLHNGGDAQLTESTSGLKALLKLTIALHEAGELK